MQTLEAIQAQLAELQKRNSAMLGIQPASTIIETQPVEQEQSSNEILLALIDERIANKLSSFAPKPTTSELSMLIEGHLEQEEIKWLMQANISSSLGGFLSSPNGHEYVRLFYTEFKEYHENLPHN
jgi:hypothetical protein